jgi:hypothetical protein
MLPPLTCVVYRPTASAFRDRIQLEDGDAMVVAFEGLRPLRNHVQIYVRQDVVAVSAL